MRSTRTHFALFALAALAVVSCDTRLPTATRRAAPGTPPDIVIDTPLVNTQVNVGDSIFVRVSATGGNALTNIELVALAVTGVKDLGTYAETPRYKTINVPFATGAGVHDTIIRRYLQPIDPNNTTLDSLIVQAIVTDSTGLKDTARVRAAIVSGPHVVIESPVPNDSVTPGVAVGVQVHATDADGIVQVQVRVKGDPTWPTKLDTLITQVFGGSERDLVFNTAAIVPLNAPGRSKITISATATDGNRQPGASAPVTIFVRSAASVSAPLVTQSVPPRSERTDTVTVTANGAGIVAVGIVVRDSVGNIVDRDSVLLPSPFTSNVKKGIALRLPVTMQGKHLAITGFAVDQSGRTGYAVRSSTLPAVTTLAAGIVDSTTIVYGQTYSLPIPGLVGDLAVDVGRGNVFLSNINNNKLEVWQNQLKRFDPTGIAVGSLPWGLAMAATRPVQQDTLLVANSGGTNISRVFIGNSSVAAMHEDLANRILTRNLFIFQVVQSRDVGTGKITASKLPIISYSDRPQYLAQSTTGRIYFSTRPTSFAPEGTVRYVETLPIYPAPDPRIIYQYAEGSSGTEFRYAIFNVDTVDIRPADPATSASDVIVMYDHPYGQLNGTICVNGPQPLCHPSTDDGTPTGNPDGSVQAVVNTMAFYGSDVEAVLRLDMTTLPLKDTTFVSASFDNHWFAFGEGNSAPSATGARVIMVADSVPAPGFIRPQFLSPLVTVRDLTENAAERVFGLALDQNGKNVLAHGLESYLSEVTNPFHLRLQGKYNSLDAGAGVAFHPLANGRNTPEPSRLAFVAASPGEIEIIDVAYFINRGRLPLKYPIYGALRASLPMPGDDPAIILKLFALTQRGLIVIDVTQADVKPGPP